MKKIIKNKMERKNNYEIDSPHGARINIDSIVNELYPTHTRYGAYCEMCDKLCIKPMSEKDFEKMYQRQKIKNRPGSVGKGKTTKILSGGAYIGKDGKRHEWSKIHSYKPNKVTDDNWMEYGMPADNETNESKNMNKKLIRLTEKDLHRIVKESVNRVLRETKFDNPHQHLDYVNNTFKRERPQFLQHIKANSNGRTEESVAQLLVDNGLTIDDLQKYDGIMSIISPSVLNQKIQEYQRFLKQEEYDDRLRDADAWAEERLSDMGFGFEGD